MNELLARPEIKKKIAKMTPEMVEWFKKLLVSQGIYTQYCRERK
jgi:hypothetical protein